MKLIIAGSRHLNFGTQIMDIACSGIPEIARMVRGHVGYDEKFKVTEVISGGADGIDKMGEYWTESMFWDLPGYQRPGLTVMKAEWEKYGGRAGNIRNAKMAAYGDVLLLIWDGKSPGSTDMKAQMLKLGKPVYEIVFKGGI